jgi:hypothetical protein
MMHGQLAREQVEVEAHDARHGLEPVANQALLSRAIHVLDAPARAARAFGRRGRVALTLLRRAVRRVAVTAGVSVRVGFRLGLSVVVIVVMTVVVVVAVTVTAVVLVTVLMPMVVGVLVTVRMIMIMIVPLILVVVVLVPVAAARAAHRPFLITRAQALRNAEPRHVALVHSRFLPKVTQSLDSL